jgi:molybdopterin/thiamine biosynthesis adenylyltransferase
VATSAFEAARLAVEQWLNGGGASFAKKVHTGADGHRLAWEVDLQGTHPLIGSFRISLPRGFPAQPCEIHVDKRLCLALPHVEEDGRVCLGNGSPPSAYENGASAVNEVLTRFNEEVLQRVVDPVWVEQEMQRERMSYWSRHCDLARETAPNAPHTTWLSLTEATELDAQGWLKGATAVYARPGQTQRRYGLQLVSAAEGDPNDLAQRHQWASGSLVRGNALVVQLPADRSWTPKTWPTDFAALEELVLASTGGVIQLSAWVSELGWTRTGATQVQKRISWKTTASVDEAPIGYSPRLVVVVDGPFAYGFQISLSGVLSRQPQITPLKVARVDRNWALARDHQLTVLDARRAMRVLLVGCGSLGSPVAELLARAGVGSLDIVDFEDLEAPNVGRHSLGLNSLNKAKAVEMAARIEKLVPGCTVRGYGAPVATWMQVRFRAEDYDLVVDCTGESSVRTLLAAIRPDLGTVPLVHAWVEPFCSAAHVVFSPFSVPWPATDPADALVNAAKFDSSAKVLLPACSEGFHPYGAADVLQAAAFTAERVIGLLDTPEVEAVVYSWVRARAFFESLGVPVELRDIVPANGGKFSSVMMERALEQLLAA